MFCCWQTDIMVPCKVFLTSRVSVFGLSFRARDGDDREREREREEILLEATVNTWPNTFSSINYQMAIKVFKRNETLNFRVPWGSYRESTCWNICSTKCCSRGYIYMTTPCILATSLLIKTFTNKTNAFRDINDCYFSTFYDSILVQTNDDIKREIRRTFVMISISLAISSQSQINCKRLKTLARKLFSFGMEQ